MSQAPPLSLRERIARFNASAAAQNEKKSPQALAPGELKERRKNFEGDATAVVPKGSFGLGAPSSSLRSSSSDRNRVASATLASSTSSQASVRSVSSSASLGSTNSSPAKQRLHTRQDSAGGLRGFLLNNDLLDSGARTPGSISSMQVETGSVTSASSADGLSVAAMTSTGPSSLATLDVNSMYVEPGMATPIAERDLDVQHIDTPARPGTPVEATADEAAAAEETNVKPVDAAEDRETDEEIARHTAKELRVYEEEETDKTRKGEEFEDVPDMEERMGSPQVIIDDVSDAVEVPDAPEETDMPDVADASDAPNRSPSSRSEAAAPVEAEAPALTEENLRKAEEQPLVIEAPSVETTPLIETSDLPPDSPKPADSPVIASPPRSNRLSSASSSPSLNRTRRISSASLPPTPPVNPPQHFVEADLADSPMIAFDADTPDVTPQLKSTAQFPSADQQEPEEVEDVQDLHHSPRASFDGVREEGHATYDILDNFSDRASEPEAADAEPQVKCSDCGAQVPITQLGEHICEPAEERPVPADMPSDPVHRVTSSMSSMTIAATPAGPQEPRQRTLSVPQDVESMHEDDPYASPADSPALDMHFPTPPSRAPAEESVKEELDSPKETLQSPTLHSRSGSPTVARPSRAFGFDSDDDTPGESGFVTVIRRTGN